jgi:phage tail tape-measure protein
VSNPVDTLLVEIKAETAQLRKGLNKVNQQLDKTKKSSGAASNALKGFGAIVSTIGLTRLVGSTIDTIRTFEDLEATLTAITGSAETAAQSFNLIRKFTSQTTFQLEGVSQAFISLLQAGVAPTEDALKDFGNLAAAFGKDISQVAQATFRAVTGEMEMLKQFNVVARLEGEKIKVTFDGVTEEIDRNGSSIAEYLRKIGREKFGTALEARANTLSGAISNVSDGIAEFAVKIGESGLKDTLITLAREMRVVLDNSKGLADAFGKVLSLAFSILGNTLIIVTKHFKVFASVALGAAVIANYALLQKVVTGLVAGFKALAVAIRAGTVASIAFQAVTTGGIGIAKITAGLAAATGAYVLLDKTIQDATPEVEDNAEATRLAALEQQQLADALTKPKTMMDRLSKSTQASLKFLQSFGVVTKTLDQQVRELGTAGALAELEKAIKAFSDERFEIAMGDFMGPIDPKKAKELMADFRKDFFAAQFDGATEDEVLQRIGLMPFGDIEGALKKVQSTLQKELDPNGINVFKELLADDNALNAFFKNAGGSAAFFGKSIEEVRATLQGFVDETEKTKDEVNGALEEILEKATDQFANDFVNALQEGQNAMVAFKNLMGNMIQQVIAEFLKMQVIKPLMNTLFTAVGLPTIPIGKAGGGTIQGGTPTLVGERGAEIFVPNTGGTIMNNMNSKNAMGGGGTTVINQSINFATGIVPTVRAEVMQMMPQIADVTKAAVQESAMRGGNFRRSLVGG